MMKSDTPLDYAEILISQTRTRCELYICATDDGVREKLASAHAKPFVAHLRAAQLQFARGESIIRLEPRSSSRSNCTWFTKATLERFVHFVSMPEVLERVKNVGDELTQLEQVRVALSKTFSQEGTKFAPAPAAMVCPADVYQEEGSMLMGSGSPRDAKSTAEASKRELLRAMDVRLAAVNQELHMAFSRALSSGFDKDTLSNLMEFSQHFGSQRLWDACLQFIGLSKRMNISLQLDEDRGSQTEDDVSSDSEMSLESGTDTGIATETDDSASCSSRAFDSWSNVQTDGLPESRNPFSRWDSSADSSGETNTSAGATSARVRGRWGPPERIQIFSLEPEFPTEVSEMDQDANGVSHPRMPTRDSSDEESRSNKYLSFTQKGRHPEFTPSLPKQLSVKNDDLVGTSTTFFSRLQKMAQQVEARRLSSDMGMHFTSLGFTDGPRDFEVGRSPDLAGSVCSSEDSHSAAVSDFSEDRMIVGPPSEVRSIVKLTKEPQVTGENFGESESNLKSTIREQQVIPTRGRDEDDEPISPSSRRLSVQAAICLFESKKGNITSPAAKKLVRQDSQNVPTSEKAVGGWSGIGPADRAIPDDASEMVARDPTTIVSQITSKSSDMTNNNHLAGGLHKQFKLELEKSLARNNRNHGHLDASASKLIGGSQVSDSGATALPENRASEVPPKLTTVISKTSNLITKSVPKDQASEIAEWKSTRVLNLTSRRDPKDQTSEIHSTKPPDSLNSSNSAKKLAGDQPSSVTKNFQTDHIPELKPVVETAENFFRSKRVTQATQDMQSVKGSAAHEGKLDFMVQNKKLLQGKSLLTESASARLKEDKTNNILEKESSNKEPNINKPKHEIDGTGQTGHKISSSGTQQKLGRKNPTTLHDAPIDLHMQALVMMIDNNHQSSLHSSNDKSCNEQKGRFYEHYRQLRDARQQKENPAKRAERETKLKCMKETLDRRKSEMEIGGLGPTNKSAKEKTIKAGSIQLQKTTPTETLKQQKELEEEMMHTDRRVSYMTSMVPKSPTNIMTRVQHSKKGLSTLHKSLKAPFSSMNASSASSPRVVPNSPAISRRKSDHNGALENPMSQKVAEVKKEVWSSTGKSFASSKVPRAVNIAVENISVDSFSGMRDEEMKRGKPLRRKDRTSGTESKASSVALDRALESFKGPLVNGSESMVNNIRSSAVHGVKSLTHKDRIGAVMQQQSRKHETTSTLRNLDEEIPSLNIYAHDCRKTGARGEDSRKPFESRNVNFSAQNTSCMASTSLEDDDEEDQADGTDVDEASDIFVDACSDERVLSLDDE